jgi:hypothetical protein
VSTRARKRGNEGGLTTGAPTNKKTKAPPILHVRDERVGYVRSAGYKKYGLPHGFLGHALLFRFGFRGLLCFVIRNIHVMLSFCHFVC